MVKLLVDVQADGISIKSFRNRSILADSRNILIKKKLIAIKNRFLDAICPNNFG